MFIKFNDIRHFLENVVKYYEQSSPTVSFWANDLYIRLDEELDDVRLSEVLTAQSLNKEGAIDGWMEPSLAANTIYKLMNRLGQDTTGHAGF